MIHSSSVPSTPEACHSEAWKSVSDDGNFGCHLQVISYDYPDINQPTRSSSIGFSYLPYHVVNPGYLRHGEVIFFPQEEGDDLGYEVRGVAGQSGIKDEITSTSPASKKLGFCWEGNSGVIKSTNPNNYPPGELTYPTIGKGILSSTFNCLFWRGYVSFLEGIQN